MRTNLGDDNVARKKDPPYVIFGAWDQPNKAIVGIRRKDSKGAGVAICEMKNGDKYGFRCNGVSQDDLTGVHAVLWFCKKESLNAMIDCLIGLRDEMEREEHETT